MPETWKRRLPQKVISDSVGRFTVYKCSKDYPEKLRKVICIRPEDGTRYIFLTNNLTTYADTISELYRNRWSVVPNVLYHNHLQPYNNSSARYET